MTQHLQFGRFLVANEQGVWRANSETGLNARFLFLDWGNDSGGASLTDIRRKIMLECSHETK